MGWGGRVETNILVALTGYLPIDALPASKLLVKLSPLLPLSCTFDYYKGCKKMFASCACVLPDLAK